MCSPCRIEAATALALLLALAACSRPNPIAPAVSTTAPAAYPLPPVSHLFPGDKPAPPEDPRGPFYDGRSEQIAAGKRYFSWYNCSGCHFNGGGGIGPALMDATWIYGGRIDEIHNSIAQGRPNGMPAWGGKIPDAQIWQIAAYVRSLSAPSTIDRGGAKPDSPPPPVAAHPPDEKGGRPAG